MKKWTFAIYVFLISWIILWTTLAGCLVYFTGNKVYYLFLIFVVFCFFNLFWWSLIKNQKKALDRFTISSFLITLNVPAYLLARKIRKTIVANEIAKHNSAKTLDLEDDLTNPFIPDWERARIETKLLKKSRKEKSLTTKNEKSFLEDNFSILLQTYNQFLLSGILKQNPKLYDTYEINEKMKLAIGEDNLDLQNVERFMSVASDWMLIDNQDTQQLFNFFSQLTPDQIYQNHKVNRVDNIIFVRHKLDLPFE